MLFSIASRTVRPTLVGTECSLKLHLADDVCFARVIIMTRRVKELRQPRREKICPMATTAY